MFKGIRTLAIAASALALSVTAALATPSTQIWIPSTDVQAFGVLHLNLDNYVRDEKMNGVVIPPTYMFGPTIGVLPFEKVQAEVGFDLIYSGTVADEDPFYANFKLATPEGAWFQYSPALAVGGYNFGTEKDVTDQNITYVLAAETLGALGRVSAGWYWANDKVIAGDDNGVLLSWDRSMPEISDKLWVAVDYQGGDNALGALNVGFSWAFSKNTSVIFGYDIMNDEDYAGPNTYTVQVDINFQ